MADKNNEEKPEKKIKRTLSPETSEERRAKAKFTEADIIACKQLVANITKPGKYFVGKTVKKISAAAAKKLWGGNGNEEN